MVEGFVDVSAILRPGVYALLREGVVVYVGKASKNMMQRVEAHRSMARRKEYPSWLRIKPIHFDGIQCFPCRVEDLDEMERQLIDLYKPKMNIRLKSPDPISTPLQLTINGHVLAMAAIDPPTTNRGVLRRF